MKPGPDGKLPYKGIVDVITKVKYLSIKYLSLDSSKRRCPWTLDWLPSLLY